DSIVLSTLTLGAQFDSIRTFCFLFFFSSRRRHTRCYRDWSSDVCSSDLARQVPIWSGNGNPIADSIELMGVRMSYARNTEIYGRSEERRVGKECRFRWSSWR